MTDTNNPWMPLGLEGKHAVVCGATQGIGLAAAQHLAGLGARVTLVARHAERLEEARRSLPQPERHGTAQADFSRPEEVKAAIGSVVNAQPVHILVNNTGGPAGGPRRRAREPGGLSIHSVPLQENSEGRARRVRCLG